MMEQVYLMAHRQLMDELRRQLKTKNTKKIHRAAVRLYKLRVRYRKRLAA
ncbi:MAG: hypothetical protein HUU41_19855 [Bryobacteraceae bacterium]|nr:hypothetical protein [Bryobacteraceae bacterium]